MPRNPDEVIRTENEIETLLVGHCRRYDGYRWMRRDNGFIITSPFRSKIQFTISSYMDIKVLVLSTIYKFFNYTQNLVITGLEATITTLDEQSNVDHIQWVNHQLPLEDRDTFRTPDVGGYGNGKSISPIPTRREIELGHRVPRFYPTLQTIPEYMFPITTPSFSSIDIPNAATVPIDSYTTPSTCIEQEEALDTDYKDDLF